MSSDSESDFDTIGRYFSGSEEEKENKITPKRKQQKRHNWTELHTFENFEAAKSEISRNDGFVRDTAKEQCNGKKVYYKCKRSRDCSAKIYLFLHGKSNLILYFCLLGLRQKGFEVTNHLNF